MTGALKMLVADTCVWSHIRTVSETYNEPIVNVKCLFAIVLHAKQSHNCIFVILCSAVASRAQFSG
jgi:hypothetical protein